MTEHDTVDPEAGDDVERAVPAPRGGGRRSRAGQRRRRILRLSTLPTIVTLGNLVCGFLAISYVADSMAAHAVGDVSTSALRLSLAGWLILAGMACDGLDGRVARMTRTTTQFGGALDSLADVVTFGVAPALLAKALMETALGFEQVRTSFLTAAFYALCACLRLARYNAEHDEPSDGVAGFSGLPTPGAAGVIAGLAILHTEFLAGWVPTAGEQRVAALALGFGVLVPLGLLMVSRVPYLHAANRLFAERRTVGGVALIVLLVVLFLHLDLGAALAAVFVVYALSGPAFVLSRALRGRRAEIPELFD